MGAASTEVLEDPPGPVEEAEELFGAGGALDAGGGEPPEELVGVPTQPGGSAGFDVQFE